MTRKQFVQLYGATCINWGFSWSFINKRKRLIIFGAFDNNTEDGRQMILSKDWMTNKGRKNKGYDQSLEHIRLIEEENYNLMTFPMEHAKRENGGVRIKKIIPVLTEKKLTSDKQAWYAIERDDVRSVRLAEEIESTQKYVEGRRFKVTINGYERNPKARAACILHHGCKCKVCGFDFEKAYGAIGVGFIHVHHLVPASRTRGQYKIDPKTDLMPVCPNCHAMIHSPTPPAPIFAIAALRKIVRKQKSGHSSSK
jgi:5-methylcytosine-specific restriction enzyme A